MNTYVEKFIERITLEDLDREFPFNDGDVMTPTKHLGNSKISSVDIDIVIKTLENLKVNGSDRVFITENSLLEGYDFYGVKLIKI